MKLNKTILFAYILLSSISCAELGFEQLKIATVGMNYEANVRGTRSTEENGEEIAETDGLGVYLSYEDMSITSKYFALTWRAAYTNGTISDNVGSASRVETFSIGPNLVCSTGLALFSIGYAIHHHKFDSIPNRNQTSHGFNFLAYLPFFNIGGSISTISSNSGRKGQYVGRFVIGIPIPFF